MSSCAYEATSKLVKKKKPQHLQMCELKRIPTEYINFPLNIFLPVHLVKMTGKVFPRYM